MCAICPGQFSSRIISYRDVASSVSMFFYGKENDLHLVYFDVLEVEV